MTKISTKNYLLATLLAISTFTNYVFAQPGKDGPLTVNSNGYVLNTYTNVTSNIAAGATTLNVTNSAMVAGGNFFSTNLASGDYILIIQMQGASIDATNTASYGSITAYNSAGLYEFACVSSVPNGTSITLAAPTVNAYSAAGKVQVVRIPRLTTLTVGSGGGGNRHITAPAWNGTTGGVVAVETTGAISFGGSQSIRVNGIGFRGGVLDNNTSTAGSGVITAYRSSSSSDGAEKGESIAGFQTEYAALNGQYGRGAPANGGGGGNGHNGGGGGGANGNNGVAYTGTGNPSTSTANWANAWNLEAANFATSTSSGGGRGGYTYGSSDQNALTVAPGNSAWGGDERDNVGGFGGHPLNASGRLFLGGGGGAGDANNSSGGAGGIGGGLVFIIAGDNITGTSIISANGTAGDNSTGGHNDAPGGGGGGGTIVIYNRKGTVANTITLRANGGAGGNQLITSAESEGPGGGGGGGYIAYNAGTPVTAILGGANGTSSSTSVTEFLPNGATVGATGLTTNSYVAHGSLFITVTGTVYADGNGHTDNLINGTASNLGGALYVSAVQSSVVVATTAVQGSGNFTFSSLPAGTYDFVFHNNPAGQTTSTLPANTQRTADGLAAAGDGTPNGIVAGTTTCAPLSTLLFGFNRQPTSTDYSGSGWGTPGGSTLENVPTAAFNGTDGEDGSYTNNLNTRTVRLFPATGGTLYYFDGVTYNPITVATDIPNFNNDNVFVDPTAPSGPTTVTFNYSVSDNGGLFNGTPATVTMGFSVLLPATGFNLQGKVNQQGALQLSWTTQSEQNTAYFEIELSNDGSSYKAIGKVAAAGNSATASKYAYQHPRPLGNKWYVRIKLVDKDGNISYSNVAVLQAPVSALAVSIAPNPTKGTVWVNGIAGAKSVWLTSANGSVLLRQAVNADQVQLDLSRFADGLYILQVVFADGQRKAVKVHKQ